MQNLAIAGKESAREREREPAILRNVKEQNKNVGCLAGTDWLATKDSGSDIVWAILGEVYQLNGA